MKVNKKQMRTWIDALYSGKYKQGKGYLNKDGRYCCLGVACLLLIPENLIRKRELDKTIIGTMPSDQWYAPKWLQQISDDIEQRFDNPDYFLPKLNDNEGATFEEIGMLLELIYIHKAL